MRIGKVLVDHHLVVLRRIDKSAFPDIEAVQQGPSVVGDGDDFADDRFGKPGDVQLDICGNAGFDLVDAGNRLYLLLETLRRPLQIDEHVGKTILPIKGVSGE